MTKTLHTPLTIKLFADGADVDAILQLGGDDRIQGFTTNPTLMRKSAITDYEGFAHKVLDHISDRPVSFEVFSDEFEEMGRQARRIASWGLNAVIKIPITNTRAESAAPLIEELTNEGLRLNVTALMTVEQVEQVAGILAGGAGAIVSVFAGRIADTGRDPVPLMKQCVAVLEPHPHVELLWASPREIFNVYQADSIGCDIITLTNDLLDKLSLFQKDLDEYSLDTVRMFYNDAKTAGFLL